MAKKKNKKTSKKKTKSKKAKAKKSGTKTSKKKKRPVSTRRRLEEALGTTGSNFIDIDDLFCAYRKAKADLFFDRSQATAIAFCRYEDDLANNLLRLHQRLKDKKSPWWKDRSFIGSTSLIPKKLDIDTEYEGADEPLGISDPEEEWSFCRSNYPATPVFRPIADFTVDMHVVSGLWINLVGEKFDSLLGEEALGTRVRRLNREDSEEKGTTYHSAVWQTFKPYFAAYKKWRNDGFRAVEKALQEDRKLILIMLDFASFFHQIDAEFLLEPKYLKASGYYDLHAGGPTEEESQFTEQLVDAFKTWDRFNPVRVEGAPVGLPVGCTASRVIANCLLVEFDKLVKQRLSPIYYARYVDDIFLVVEDHGQFGSRSSITEFLCKQLEPYAKPISNDSDGIKIELPYAQKSNLCFQTEKQRYFKLNGKSGLELLDTIRSNIDDMTSEWRLLPDVRELEESASVRVLTNSTDQLEAHALRKTDGLSVRRLGLALLLRKMRALAAMLPDKEWAKTRNKLFDLACRHVITPLRIFDLYIYLPQLLGLAVGTSSWGMAHKLVGRIGSVFEELKEHDSTKTTELFGPYEMRWNCLHSNLRDLLKEAVLQNVPLHLGASELEGPIDELTRQIAILGTTEKTHLNDYDPVEVAEELYCRDLAAYPFKEQLFGDIGKPMLPDELLNTKKGASRFCRWLDVVHSETLGKRGAQIWKFTDAAGRQRHELPALLFPTRPLSVEEVTICVPETNFDIEELKKYVNAIRGTWYRKEKFVQVGEGESRVEIGVGERKSKPKIALTNVLTRDESWCLAAAGKPDLSTKRYQQLVKLCLSIARESRDQRIDYVVFPELSIPRAWLFSIARFFINYRISLIAGVEYEHVRENEVLNQAFLFLTDNRIGYPSWTVIYQQKQKPALHEGRELWDKFNAEFSVAKSDFCTKRVYCHFGFEFGLLVCSELTNIDFRQHFRGKIDSLLVLSWNRDLDSFEALVDSAALDIHCFLVLVNNRKYGDSRVRVPYSKHWRRDPVRVKGGLADYFVIAEIDYDPLRDFQSHKVSPKGLFKPKPEGFKISKTREVVPGGK